MRILHVSTFEQNGGAARAAQRLHRGLQAAGVESLMAVQHRQTNDPQVGQIPPRPWLSRSRCERLLLSRYPRWQPPFYAARLPGWLPREVGRVDPDVIHLHWILGGLVRIEQLQRLGRPMVWTLHDMWPLTGGCNYSGECQRYSASCGRCPRLGSERDEDLSRRIWQRKQRTYAALDLRLVAPSAWMAARARESSLMESRPIEVIANGLDLEVFRPHSMAEARREWHLPLDRKIILFGADGGTRNPIKGWDLLAETLVELGGAVDAPLTVVVFGGRERLSIRNGTVEEIHVGRVDEDGALARLYSAADVMAVPSRQECFGQVASEALACGTPVVAFASGGLADIVVHRDCGYLARPFDVTDFAQGLKEALARLEMRDAARRRAISQFAVAGQTQRYLEVYRQLM